MTRALIADPELAGEGAHRAGSPSSSAASAATPASPTTTRGTPIAVRGQSRHRPRAARRADGGRGRPAPARRRRRRPGRASRPRSRRAAPAMRSCCSSAARGSAARSRSRARRPAGAKLAATHSSTTPPGSSRPRRRARHGAQATRPPCSRSLRMRSSSRPAHARIRDDGLPLDGVDADRRVGRARGTGAAGDSVLVADWGGDQSGLDAAEVLAAAGKRVMLAVASLAVGRDRPPVPPQPLPAAALPRRRHDPPPSRARRRRRRRGPAAQRVRTRAGPRRCDADAVVLALGRVPRSRWRPSLPRTGSRSREAGDCRSPRSLEEAVLEGTLAARDVFA